MSFRAQNVRRGSRTLTLVAFVCLVCAQVAVPIACQQVAATAAAGPHFLIEDWFGESKARVRIGSQQGTVATVVLADDIDLGGRTYSYGGGTAPKNVIIIANVLRLTDLAQFDLSAAVRPNDTDRSAGELIIFARHVVCNRDGRLMFRGVPDTSPAPPTGVTGGVVGAATPFAPAVPFAPVAAVPVSMPHFGEFLLGAELVEVSQDAKESILQRELLHDPLMPHVSGEPLLPEVVAKLLSLIDATYDDAGIRNELKAVVNGKNTFDNDLLAVLFKLRRDALDISLAKGETDLFQKFIAGAEIDIPVPPLLGGITPVTPPAGVFRVVTDATALMQYEPQFKLALSEWCVRYLAEISRHLAEAKLSGDRGDLFTYLNLAEHFPHYPIDAAVEDRYEQQINAIQQLKTQIAVGLHVELVNTVAADGSPIEIDTYSEGASSEYRVAPTNALLREYLLDGERKIGLCRFDPDDPHELEFYLTADLTVDPSLSSTLRNYFASHGESYSGEFTRWSLTFLGFDTIPGLVKDKSTITVSGEILQAKLVFSDSGIGLIQWSTSGIPLRFHWEYREDPSIGGTFDSLLFTRTSRADPQIAVVQGTATNQGKAPVRIRYAVAGDRIINFAPQVIEIDPGQSASLPLAADIDKASVVVPPEAVTIVYTNLQDYSQDFKVITGGQLAEQVTVDNELSINGLPAKGAIESIMVQVSYDNGNPDEGLQHWNVELLPSPSPGAVATHWFYRSPQTSRTITVTGRVKYADGSFDDLKKWTEPTSTVRIGIEAIPSS